MRLFILVFFLATMGKAMEESGPIKIPTILTDPETNQPIHLPFEEIKTEDWSPYRLYKVRIYGNLLVPENPEHFYLLETPTTIHRLFKIDFDKRQLIYIKNITDDNEKNRLNYWDGIKNNNDNDNDFDTPMQNNNPESFIKRRVSLGLYDLVIPKNKFVDKPVARVCNSREKILNEEAVH